MTQTQTPTPSAEHAMPGILRKALPAAALCAALVCSAHASEPTEAPWRPAPSVTIERDQREWQPDARLRPPAAERQSIALDFAIEPATDGQPVTIDRSHDAERMRAARPLAASPQAMTTQACQGVETSREQAMRQRAACAR